MSDLLSKDLSPSLPFAQYFGKETISSVSTRLFQVVQHDREVLMAKATTTDGSEQDSEVVSESSPSQNETLLDKELINILSDGDYSDILFFLGLLNRLYFDFYNSDQLHNGFPTEENSAAYLELLNQWEINTMRKFLQNFHVAYRFLDKVLELKGILIQMRPTGLIDHTQLRAPDGLGANKVGLVSARDTIRFREVVSFASSIIVEAKILNLIQDAEAQRIPISDFAEIRVYEELTQRRFQL